MKALPKEFLARYKQVIEYSTLRKYWFKLKDDTFDKDKHTDTEDLKFEDGWLQEFRLYDADKADDKYQEEAHIDYLNLGSYQHDRILMEKCIYDYCMMEDDKVFQTLLKKLSK